MLFFQARVRSHSRKLLESWAVSSAQMCMSEDFFTNLLWTVSDDPYVWNGYHQQYISDLDSCRSCDIPMITITGCVLTILQNSGGWCQISRSKLSATNKIIFRQPRSTRICFRALSGYLALLLAGILQQLCLPGIWLVHPSRAFWFAKMTSYHLKQDSSAHKDHCKSTGSWG